MEIVTGQIKTWLTDGRVVIEAGLPNVDRAIIRQYDKVLVGLPDGRRISPDQRRKAHALIGEIAEWIGDVPAYIKKLMKMEFVVNRLQALEKQTFSLASCDCTTAKEFITFLIDFMVEHGVPSRIPLYEQCEDIRRYVFACAMNKRCVVCGKNKAEVHHLTGSRVGHGGVNWREKPQDGVQFLPLCRQHHMEAHNGEKDFLARYHLEGIEMTREIGKVYGAGKKAFKEED